MIFDRRDSNPIRIDKLIEMVKETNGKYPSAFGKYALGIPIQESQWLYSTEFVRRTLRERLFGLHEGKWRPFLRGYTIKVPDPMVYIVNNHNSKIIVAHPATIARLKDALNAPAQEA